MTNSKIIAVPIDRLKEIEDVVGRKLARNQTPIVKIRVHKDDVEKIKKVLST